MSNNKGAALAAFEARFAKNFGEGRLTRQRKGVERPERIVVSTGSLTLDHALGVGGLVVGRCYESWGPPGVGKSTMNLLMARQQQLRFPDKLIGWIDVERTWDDDWALAHGIDLSQLWLATPNTAEEVSDQVRDFLKSGLCSFVTVDSIGALIGQKEIDRNAEEMVVGTVAKIVTRMIRMAAPAAAEQGATFHVINQVRAAIGSYGADTAPGGGFALQHGTTAQMTFRSTGETPPSVGTGKDKIEVGKTINVVVTKNKVAPPKRSAMITLLNTETELHGKVGLDQASEAFKLGERFGMFDRKGAWYTLSDGSRHNGGDAVKEHLRANPEMVMGIRERVLSAVAHTVIRDEITGETEGEAAEAEVSV